MAIDFDGDNLLITLDTAVTEVDVVNDLYKDWKDWMLSNPLNRRYPQAFISDGGNPLTAVINQGSYIFLQNQYGWRIKPPEEDITIYLTGNLAVNDIAVEAIIPTTGNFTAAVIGLQPITQGVIPSMRDNLEFTTFQDQIVLNSTTGTIPGVAPAYVGSNRVGTRGSPAGDLQTVLDIANYDGLTQIQLSASYDSTGETVDFSAGFRFEADSLAYDFTIDDALDLTNCSFESMGLTGSVDGVNKITRCDVNNITNFSGDLVQSDLHGDVSCTGGAQPVHVLSCYSAVAALGYPRVIGIGTQEVIIRDFRGSIGIAGMTGGDHSMGVYGGRLVVEASCSGGTIYVRGDPYEVVDLSGGAVTLVIQTTPEAVKDKIWDTQLTELTDLDTVGGHLAEAVLTVGKFIGLK